MSLEVSQIFSEENCCADKIANTDLLFLNSDWYENIQITIRDDFHENTLGLSMFRFFNLMLKYIYINYTPFFSYTRILI